ncbi:MAG TPA: sensor histidine kinase [Acidimicrobiales bacterium]|nr:sensor histidine kinase [Acidimicrobiales bacterium]
MIDTLSRDNQGAGDLTGFRHEALFYAGPDEFLAATTRFVRDGLAAREAVMVALPTGHLELLRGVLGPDAARVVFADMLDVGRNPALMIPAWRRFVTLHVEAGRPVRGIGEPLWRGRRREELVECQLHEELVNLAFSGPPAWRLLCPYDVESLDADVLLAARRSHPHVHEAGRPQASKSFRSLPGSALLRAPLPEPTVNTDDLDFDSDSLSRVRTEVVRWSAGMLEPGRAADLSLAVHEVAANSIRHGGGSGRLRCWQQAETFVCEVRDSGCIDRALVGREMPPLDNEFGRGLWLANQLCDLVQVRSSADGTVVRLHLALA